MKPTFKFIILLLVIATVLVGYAMIPKESINDGEGMPRQIALRKMLSEIPPEVKAKMKADSLLKAKKEEASNDTTTQSILFFGDSMVPPFSFRLRDYTTENGHKLTSVVWYGSTTQQWAVSDTLQYYVRQYKPTHVFICLGGNEMYVNDMEKVEKSVRIIQEKLKGIPVVWIGPPNWTEDKGFNATIRSVVGDRAYYPSYKLTFERRKDGHHPTDASAAIWCDKVMAWISAGKSVHKFRLRTPKPDIKGKQSIIQIRTYRGRLEDLKHWDASKGDGKTLDK